MSEWLKGKWRIYPLKMTKEKARMIGKCRLKALQSRKERMVRLGKTTIRLWQGYGQCYAIFNFGRYDKRKGIESIETYTSYSSLAEGDRKYTEVWTDKQKGAVVGFVVRWDE